MKLDLFCRITADSTGDREIDIATVDLLERSFGR